MIIIQIFILLILVIMLAIMANYYNKMCEIYELQNQFNNMERAYANKVQKINHDYLEQIATLKKEIEIKDEFVDKIYNRQSQIEKYLRTKLK